MSSNVIALKPHGSLPSRELKRAVNRFAFTETRLEALRPSAQSIIYYDTASPLAVRLTPAGAKTYLFYKWAAGRPLKLKLGRVGEVRLEDAKREAHRAAAAIAGGRDPAAERRQARLQGMTLNELWDQWKIRKWAGLRPRSREGFDSCWRNHIEPACGRTAVSRIARVDLQRLVDKVAGSGKTATARKVKGVVHMLLAEGVRLDVVPANAAAGVEAPAYVPRSRIVLSHEREPLLAAIDAAGEPWTNFFKLLMLTGARVSNVCSMAWADLDLDAATWRIPAGRSKSKRTTVLPLVPNAVTILRKRQARRSGEPWVFPSSHSHTGHVTGYREAWTSVIKHAGIKGLTRHDLRRSLATMMAALGVGDRIIAAALGHTSLSAVRVYTHLAGEIARDAVLQAATALTARRP